MRSWGILRGATFQIETNEEAGYIQRLKPKWDFGYLGKKEREIRRSKENRVLKEGGL